MPIHSPSHSLSAEVPNWYRERCLWLALHGKQGSLAQKIEETRRRLAILDADISAGTIYQHPGFFKDSIPHENGFSERFCATSDPIEIERILRTVRDFLWNRLDCLELAWNTSQDFARALSLPNAFQTFAKEWVLGRRVRRDFLADWENFNRRCDIEATLWPQGLEAPMKQGGAGDCYLLAALDALRHHEEGQECVVDLLRHGDAGTWLVHFPSNGAPYTSTPKDLEELKKVGKASQASLGDRVIERAYARLVKNRRSFYRGELTIRPEAAPMHFEGGSSLDAFRDICGENRISRLIVQLSTFHGGQFSTFHHGRDVRALTNPQANQVFCSASFHPTDVMDHSGRFRDAHARIGNMMEPDQVQRLRERVTHPDDSSHAHGIKYRVPDAEGEPVRVSFSHAYSVRVIDPTREVMLLVNPHDTQNDQICVSFETFLESFRSLYVGTFYPRS